MKMKDLPYRNAWNLLLKVIRSTPGVIILACLTGLTGCSSRREAGKEIDRVPVIFPDYYNLTLPPNIAPLNFVIREQGSLYKVTISAPGGKPLVISQHSPVIKIPVAGWKRILQSGTGHTLHLKIEVLNNKKWYKFREIKHAISADPIDQFLVYRLVHATYLMWRNMEIYQRDLTGFNEFPLVVNSSTGYGCFNCHSFANKNPDKMLIHFRIVHPATLLWNNGSLSAIDTRTPGTLSGGIYPAWHPGGRYIAFSVGKLSPHLTTRSDKVVDVSDKVSDLIVYDIESKKVITSPQISGNRRENMPVWSADGKYLYFISAPEAIPGNRESRLHARYDLMRIGFDMKDQIFGMPEMVLSSEKTGLSISMPSVSPDGRFLVCSMSDFGYFTIFHKKSDLYLFDLATGEYKKLELNSHSAESYSTWSSNSRWLIFSSKRMDDVHTRPYIAYIDSCGVAHNPFVLPREDPEYYESIPANFNRPELITGKIGISPFKIRDKILGLPEKQ